MSQTLRYFIRFGLYCTTLGLASVWAFILTLAMTLARQNSSIQHYVARSFYYFASPIVGWKLDIENQNRLSSEGATVFIGNHQSMIDILYLGRIFPKRCSVMAKRSLKWVPFLGQFMWLSNAVFIDRKNREDAVKTFSRAADDMKRKRMSIFIFAEGTRSNQPQPTMLPFKKGAFHLAVQGQFPLVPIVMENYYPLYAGHARKFEAGTLTIRVLEPIETKGFTSSSEDIGKLSELARERMLDAIKDMSDQRQRNINRRSD